MARENFRSQTDLHLPWRASVNKKDQYRRARPADTLFSETNPAAVMTVVAGQQAHRSCGNEQLGLLIHTFLRVRG